MKQELAAYCKERLSSTDLDGNKWGFQKQVHKLVQQAGTKRQTEIILNTACN